MTLAVRVVLLAAMLAGRPAIAFAQDPAPDEVQRVLRAQPVDGKACLTLADRTATPSVAQPLFDCWRATASREDLIHQAASASWTVRGLSLRALTHSPASPINALRTAPGSAPYNEWAIAPVLVKSIVDILSRDALGPPGVIAPQTVQQARDALWDLSDRNMTVALDWADRITPIVGRDRTTGRFGESYDLASKDPWAYAARRRAWQFLIAGALAAFFATLRVGRAARPFATALLAAVFMWGAWFSFQNDVRELPPPPLWFLTASFLAFLSAGVVSGVTAVLRIPAWQRVAAAPLAAAAAAFLLCAVTRSAGLFPSGEAGGPLMLEPSGSALLAAAGALAIALGLVLEERGELPLTSGAAAAERQPSRHF